jgi:LPS export ABC transporter protein LptC
MTKKKLLPLSFNLVIFLLFVSLISTGGCSKKKENIPQISDTTVTPCQEVGNYTLFCYRGKHLIWKLDSDYSWKTLSDTGSMLVVPVRLSIYDSLGEKTTKVLSDSGNTNKNLERFFLWSNVYIKNWDGFIIESESLWWNKTTRLVGSDDFVQIKTPNGDVLRGKGLDASESFSWWTLRTNVSGEFPDFRKRMEEDEEF